MPFDLYAEIGTQIYVTRIYAFVFCRKQGSKNDNVSCIPSHFSATYSLFLYSGQTIAQLCYFALYRHSINPKEYLGIIPQSIND